MTSLDSKLSANVKLLSGHSSNTENKKGAVTKQSVVEESVVNNGLTPISEVSHEVMVAPVPVPSKLSLSLLVSSAAVA
jgi:hypothetical protein